MCEHLAAHGSHHRTVIIFCPAPADANSHHLAPIRPLGSLVGVFPSDTPPSSLSFPVSPIPNIFLFPSPSLPLLHSLTLFFSPSALRARYLPPSSANSQSRADRQLSRRATARSRDCWLWAFEVLGHSPAAPWHDCVCVRARSCARARVCVCVCVHRQHPGTIPTIFLLFVPFSCAFSSCNHIRVIE